MPTLKRPHILMLLAISACQFAFGASSEMRTWTDQQGRTLEASLISYDERSATGSFRRSDGMIVKIPRNLLAQADQAQLDTLSSASSTSTADTQQEAIEKQSENYIFSRLSKTGTRGYINTHEGWEYQAKALKVKVRYRGDLPTSQTQYLKAYFYDRNSELIQRYKQAARIQDEDGNYSDPPKSFKKNESYELYFPVSNFLEGRDWQRTRGRRQDLSQRRPQRICLLRAQTHFRLQPLDPIQQRITNCSRADEVRHQQRTQVHI